MQSHLLPAMSSGKRQRAWIAMTIVMVPHDINQAAQYSDRLIVLKRGKIHYDGIPHCVMCKEMFQQFLELMQIFISKTVVHSLRQCGYVRNNVNKGVPDFSDTPYLG